ncbi:mucin-5B-like isoform X2 [Littorina saxatilis]|uniref:mucin-5B-like isoform X2 n=1 Tax=Littorina saxatilis TaxID=31220 RepID=UPI0038B45112
MKLSLLLGAVAFYMAFVARVDATNYAKYLKVSSGKVTQPQAVLLCKRQGRGLPKVKTAKDLIDLRAFTKVSDVWLDMGYDGRTWKASDGSTYTIGANYWYSGEPNSLSTEKCGRVAYESAKRAFRYRSTPCGKAYGFAVCGPKGTVAPAPAPAPAPKPAPPATDAKYLKVGSGKVTQPQAVQLCKRYGRGLPKVKTAKDLIDLRAFTKVSDVWLDMGYDGRTWKASDGSTYTIGANYWYSGEPNSLSTEKCGRVAYEWAKRAFRYRSTPCGKAYGYAVCGPKGTVAPAPAPAPAPKPAPPATDAKYLKVGSGKVTQPQAVQLCKRYGRGLPKVKTAKDLIDLRAFTKVSDVWLDMGYDGRTWKASDGSTYTIGANYWYSGEPNSLSTEKCGRVAYEWAKRAFRYRSTPCGKAYGYAVCGPKGTVAPAPAPAPAPKPAPPATDAKYLKVGSGKVTQPQAVLLCKRQGRGLPKVKTAKDLIDLRAFTKVSDVWLDMGYDGRTWKASDGSTYTIGANYWYSGEPNSLSTEKCGRVAYESAKRAFRYRSTPCGKAYGFAVCGPKGTVTAPAPSPALPPYVPAPPATGTVKCTDGFYNFQGTCVKIIRCTKTWADALKYCFNLGAKLYNPQYLSTALAGLNKYNIVKGHKFFIGGARSLGTSSLFASTLTAGVQFEKNLMTKIAQKFGVDLKTLAARWSGRCGSTTLSKDNGKCMEVSFQGASPEVRAVDCTATNQFVCQKDNDWQADEVSQTGWFSLRTGTSRYDYESFNTYRCYIKQKRLTGKVTCTKPLACQCRKKGTSTVMDSRRGVNNLNAYLYPWYSCQVVGNDCRFKCGARSGKTCGDFEMNVICPKTTVNNCDLVSNKLQCSRQNRICQNSGTGFVCAVKPNTGSVNTGSCTTASGASIGTKKCSATGDPHYTTFDGVKYNFQGACCYTFAKVCQKTAGIEDFRVTVCNDKRGKPASKVSWTREVTFFYKSKAYRFTREMFTVEGRRMVGGFNGDVSVRVCKSSRGTAYTLRTGCLTLYWDGRQSVHLTLSQAYQNRVCGLCGNMNGNTKDEFTLRDTSTITNPIAFANSYLIDSPDHTEKECGGVKAEPACAPAVEEKYKVNKYCGFYNPSNTDSPVVKLLSPATNAANKQYLENVFKGCITDHCENDGESADFINKEITCPTADDVEEQIVDARGAAPVGDWKAVLGCPSECTKPNTVFSAEKKMCEDSCVDRNAEDVCDNNAKIRGCVCKDNYILDGVTGACIPVDDCEKNCYDIKKEGEQDGESFSLPNGKEQLLEPCVLKVECVDGTAKEVNLDRCHADAHCQDNKCVCRTGYIGNGYSCTRVQKECRPGWTSVGRKCYKIVDQSLSWNEASRSCCDALAQLARVDNEDEDDTLNEFLADNAEPNKKYWVAGDTTTVGANQRVAALPTSLDKSAYKVVSNQNTVLGCYYTEKNGIQAVQQNCLTTYAAICEYANPDKEEVEPTEKKETEYFQVNLKSNYWTARAQCAKQGGMLPEPRTKEQNTKLVNFQKARNLAFIRIGLYYKTGTAKDFNWNSGGTLSFSSRAFNGWGLKYSATDSEPNLMNAASSRSEQSVVSDMKTGMWRSRKASDYYPLVCQREVKISSGGPKFLTVSSSKTTFAKARELCKAQGRDLPLLKTAADLTELAKFTSLRLEDVWVGLEDKDGKNVWKFHDGSSFNFPKTFWYNGEPNLIGSERCGRVDKSGSAYRFRSSPCAKNWAAAVCGPRTRDLPYVWSPYIKTQPKIAKSVAGILQGELAKANGVRFACSEPMAVDCEVGIGRGKYENARSKSAKVLCTTQKIQCDPDNCNDFRVRFFCPNEQNMCEAVAKLKGSSPCPGGQQCIPEVSGCFSCQCPPGFTMGHDGKCAKTCGHCYVHGDPHYKIFNGDIFDFQGKCTYLINGICPDAVSKLQPGVLKYSVEVNNVACNPKRPGVSCLKSITIRLTDVPTASGQREDYIIKRDRTTSYFTVGGKRNNGEFSVKSGDGKVQFSARMSGSNFIFKGIGGLQVTSQGSKLTLTPPANLRDEMCGICGQCLEEVKFGGPDGRRIKLPKRGTKVLASTANELGTSWLVNDDTLTAEDCKVEPLPTPDPTKVKEAEEKCKVINDPTGDFKDCLVTNVDLQTFYDTCVFDGSQDDVSDICASIKSAADACAKVGVTVKWRKSDRCPLDCNDSPNMEYSSNVMCQKQCGDTVAPSCSDLEDSDGCACKDNFVMLNGKCVTKEECGCRYNYGGGSTITLSPNEEVLSKDCKKKLKCIPGGTVAETVYSKDPNAICVQDVPSVLECSYGYKMKDDMETCERNPRECDRSLGYTDEGGQCLKIPQDPRIFRRAVEKCNLENAALMRIDVVEKLDDLKKLMIRKRLAKVFVAGLVRVSRDGTVEPVLTAQQRKLIKYKNYAASDFPGLGQVQPPQNLDPADLPINGKVFAVAARLNGGVISLVAIPRDSKINFVCEERIDDPTENEDTPYCSTDSASTFSSEVERVNALMQVEKCKMCPRPMSVRCRAIANKNLIFNSDRPNNAPNTVRAANCRVNNGILYSCAEQNGAVCSDVEVSGRCPPDVNECDEGLDDCSLDQTCQNTNGAYLCKCSPARPLMVNNVCKTQQKCIMEGTQGAAQYDLRLQTFASDAAGLLDYQCSMNFAKVCNQVGGDQPFTIVVKNTKVMNRAVQDVAITVNAVGKPGTTLFEFPENIRKLGKFKLDGKVRLAAAIRDSKTGVTVSPLGNDGSYLLAEENNKFKIMIIPRSDGTLASLTLEVSDDYRNKICGLCKMPAASRYTIESPPESTEVPTGTTRCTPIITTTAAPRTTTPAPITTPLFTTRSTTTRASIPPPAPAPPPLAPAPPPTAPAPPPTAPAPPPTAPAPPPTRPTTTTTTAAPPPATTTPAAPPRPPTTTTPAAPPPGPIGGPPPTPPPTTSTTTTTTPKPTTTTTTTTTLPPTTTTTMTPPPTTTTTTTPPPTTTTTTTTTTPKPTTTTTTTTTTPPPTTTTTTTPPPTTTTTTTSPPTTTTTTTLPPTTTTTTTPPPTTTTTTTPPPTTTTTTTPPPTTTTTTTPPPTTTTTTTPPPTTTTTTTPPPTTTTTTTPPPTTTTTTTPPPTTTTTTTPAPDPCQAQMDFCNKMKSYCNIEVADCVEQTCERDVKECDYISTTTFYQCQKAGQAELAKFLKANCQKECGPNQMLVLWPVSEGVPSCRDQDFDPLSESVALDLAFKCMCDNNRGYFYENKQCVPKTECGCSMDGGDYRPLGDTWSEDDCSKDYACKAGEIVTKERTCDKNSVCVKDGEKPECQCKDDDKDRGVPTMPNGCTPTPRGNETCYLMGSEDEKCYCNKGFAPTCDGCQDINECALQEGLCNGRRERCENTAGSYRCACQDGFKRNARGKCVDINECMELDNPCGKAGAGARCVNFIGKYSCQCCAGYDLVAGGKCQRNTARVPVMPSNPPCCPCPGSLVECILPQNGPANGCYVSSRGFAKNYEQFRYLYEEYCLAGKTVNPSRWKYGKCPSFLPTEPPPGSSPSTSPAGPPPVETQPPRRECTKGNTCDKIPTPPSLSNSEVCGPSGPNEKTYESYCNMLIALCNQAGGPDSFNPPSAPSAKPGACPTTPPPTTPEPPTTLEPLNFSDWTPLSPCTLEDERDIAKGCGRGKRYRTRELLDANPPRQALPSELAEEVPCYVYCPTEPTPPGENTTT